MSYGEQKEAFDVSEIEFRTQLASVDMDELSEILDMLNTGKDFFKERLEIAHERYSELEDVEYGDVDIDED